MIRHLPFERSWALPPAADGLLPIRGLPAAGWILLLFLLQGCSLVGGSSAPGPSPPPGPSAAGAPPPGRLVGWTQTGMASWYGNPFHGRRTASGEVYDMDRLTAAHPNLPFGTRIRVENLDNGKSVLLRVNDRGPFAKDRILDVSRRAARELEMVGPGTARVRITVLEGPGQSGDSLAKTRGRPQVVPHRCWLRFTFSGA